MSRRHFPAADGFPAVDAISAKTRERGLVVTQFTAWGFEPGMNDPANHDDVVSAIEAGCATAKR